MAAYQRGNSFSDAMPPPPVDDLRDLRRELRGIERRQLLSAQLAQHVVAAATRCCLLLGAVVDGLQGPRLLGDLGAERRDLRRTRFKKKKGGAGAGRRALIFVMPARWTPLLPKPKPSLAPSLSSTRTTCITPALHALKRGVSPVTSSTIQMVVLLPRSSRALHGGLRMVSKSFCVEVHRRN